MNIIKIYCLEVKKNWKNNSKLKSLIKMEKIKIKSILKKGMAMDMATVANLEGEMVTQIQILSLVEVCGKYK